ncbi:acyl carrier protein [Crenothrix sp.]|uniref:acyl carrier protein n=1 Tax=Crenothrix sp. TaxID=3100433 RepID=UPI00374DB49D
MKNAMESNAGAISSKDEIIETVIDIFVREIGFIEREEVSRATHIVKDFYIYTDDLSLFLLAVEKHFGIKPATEEWSSFEPTIERIADFVLQHLLKKQ